jgi:hypothetical protein
MQPGLRERIGNAIGDVWAPAIAAISHARHARTFHPTGHTFAGRIEPTGDGPLARRFDGRVLARFSGALWKREREHLDVLGLALRIRPGAGPDLDHVPRPGDQDLLTATIRSPLTMVLSPLFTDASDFAGNRYWAVSPFAIEAHRYELRLSPVEPPATRGSRLDRLREAVTAHRAAWWLEARRTLHLRWERVARLSLEHAIEIDQAALRFDPFRTGLGLEPVGVVHAIRRAVYAASQRARPGA